MVSQRKTASPVTRSQFVKEIRQDKNKINGLKANGKEEQLTNHSLCSLDGAVGGFCEEVELNKKITRLQSRKLTHQNSLNVSKLSENKESNSMRSVVNRRSANESNKQCSNAKVTSKTIISHVSNDCISLSEFRELSKSVQFLSNSFDEMSKKLKEISSENQKLKAENIGLKKCTENLSEEVYKIKMEINSINQENLSSKLSIKGMEKLNDAAIKEDILSMAKTANISMSQSDIKHVLQISNEKIQNSSTSTIITFQTIEKRNNFYQEVKKQRIVRKTNVAGNIINKPIYVNDCLTKENYLLLSATIKLKRFGIKFVWTQNGNILLRKSENTPIIRVRDKKHLDLIEEELILS